MPTSPNDSLSRSAFRAITEVNDGSPVSDVAERNALYTEAADQWMVDLPVIYVYHHKRFFGLDPNLDGFTPIPDGIMRVKGMTSAE